MTVCEQRGILLAPCYYKYREEIYLNGYLCNNPPNINIKLEIP